MAALLVLPAVAGCGSVTAARDLPPAAGPARSPTLTQRPAGRVVPGRSVPEPSRTVAVVDGGRATAVLSGRERVLEVDDRATRQRVPAGVGPTHVVAGRGGLIYVLDTTGDGLLVFELRPHLHLTRRLPILGSPYGIAADPVNQRLWVTTTKTNRLVELADGARPHRLRAFPAVRQPDTVAVDPERHRVYVTGRADGVLQIVDARDR
jgi:DNA-binding beta-propeller fold protein YncE